MKWINCKDRLPGDVKKLYLVNDSKIVIRRVDNKNIICDYFNLYGEKWGLENFEWLDESVEAAGVQENEGFKYPTYLQAGGDKKWDDMNELEQANYNLCKALNALSVSKTTVKRLREKLSTLPQQDSGKQCCQEKDREIAELKAWKESAISVTPPMQEIAKVIGVKLGHSIHDKILPAIQDRDRTIAELREFLKAHEQWEADFISENSMWWPYREKDALNGKLYEDFLKLQEKRNKLIKADIEDEILICGLDEQQCQQECKHKSNRKNCPFVTVAESLLSKH